MTFINTLEGYMEGTSTAEDVRQAALAVVDTPTASLDAENNEIVPDNGPTYQSGAYQLKPGHAIGHKAIDLAHEDPFQLVLRLADVDELIRGIEATPSQEKK